MLRFAADENFNGKIVRGLQRRAPELDLVRLQDIGMTGDDDEVVLAWAADAGRILLTHDVATITLYAYQRLRAGKAMPGVIEVNPEMPIGAAIEELLLFAFASSPSDVDNQILYLPLR